jgi:hypothetical protein
VAQADNLYGATVLDGRNRLVACERAGFERAFVEFAGDNAGALALVISLNVQRRELTAGQRAVVAARSLGLNGYSKGGRPEKGEPSQPETVSVHVLARQFKVSTNSIAQARDLLAESPDLTAQVEACVVTLATAHAEAIRRARELRAAAI